MAARKGTTRHAVDRPAAGIASAVAVARAALAAAPCSTTAYIQLLDLGQVDFPDVLGFQTLAERLGGTADRPGPDEIDDSDPLRKVAEMRAAGHGSASVGMVARMVAPGDPDLQETLAHRWRRKLREKRTS